MFKVGDKVRCIDNQSDRYINDSCIKLGQTYEVARVDGGIVVAGKDLRGGIMLSREGTSYSWWVDARCFVLANKNETEEEALLTLGVRYGYGSCV